MQKPPASKGRQIQLLDTLVWLWLAISFVSLIWWRSSIATTVAAVSGLLLLGASLWIYRSVGGAWLRLIIGLAFILGVIWVAV